jgi:hypothetical protein
VTCADSGKSSSFIRGFSDKKLTFRKGELSKMMVKIEGIPIPTTLTAVASAHELECAIPNCTLRAEE